MNILAYIVNRLKEPSTYAGLGALLGIVGLKWTPEQLQGVVGVVTAIASAIAIFVPDLNKPQS